ncbi:MAG: alternative ribosome rescue aminoacyl-tRNA hydrolase ArfB [Desertimonas sp.]
MADDVNDDLRVGPRLTIPAAELTWRFSRSSGAGGQHVNTSDTRVELSWDVAGSDAVDGRQRARLRATLRPRLADGVLTVVAAERRSQHRNRADARQRLAALVAEALAPPPPARRPTRPTRGSQRRRVDAKKRRGETKRLRRPPTD